MLSPLQYPLALWHDPVWQLSERLSVDHWTAQRTDGLHACWVQIISTLTGLLIQLLALDLKPGQMTYLLLLAPQQQTEHDISHDTRSLTYIVWWPHFHKPKLPLTWKEIHRTEWNKEWRLWYVQTDLVKWWMDWQSQHVIKLIKFISSIHVPGLIVHDSLVHVILIKKKSRFCNLLSKYNYLLHLRNDFLVRLISQIPLIFQSPDANLE